MSIGDNIIKFREQKGWSQQRLAKEAGISQASIHYWENGARTPKSKSIAKIAVALGVNYSDIDDAGESYIIFRPQDCHSSKLFAGVGGLNSEEQMEKVIDYTKNAIPAERTNLLLKHFDKLNESGQEKAIEHAEMLTKIPEYRKENNP